jgi:hypothetical protein
VYLDTWAVRLFAEDDLATGDRFREALHRIGGTLVVSDLSLGNFAAFADTRRV